MEKLIVYASKYGTSKKYAAYLHEKTGYPVTTVEKLPIQMNTVSEVILIGGVYASKISGLKETIKLAPKQLTVIAVGMNDPENVENQHLLQEQVDQLRNGIPLKNIFYLRGLLTVKKLSFPHKLIINTLYKKAKKEKENADSTAQALIAGYEGTSKLEFERLDSLIPGL